MSTFKRFHPYERSDSSPRHAAHSFSQDITSVSDHSFVREKTSLMVSQGLRQTDTKTCYNNNDFKTRPYCENPLSLIGTEKEKHMCPPLKKNDEKNEFKSYLYVDDENESSDELPDIEDSFGYEYPVKTTEYETVKDECRDIETPLKKLKLSDDLYIPKTEISESKVTTKSYPVLFTKEHKTKLAKLISKVKLKEKESPSRSNSPTLSSNSQNNERHFMDILDSLNVNGKLPDESDTTESVKTPLPYPDNKSSLLQENCSWNLDNFHACYIENSSVELVRSSPNKHDTKEKTTLVWVENHKTFVEDQKNIDSLTDNTLPKTVQYGCDLPVNIVVDNESETQDIKSVMPIPYKPEETQNPIYPTNTHHSSTRKVLFPYKSEINGIESLSIKHINYFEAAIEEGDQFVDFGLDALKRFVLQQKPTNDVLDMLLHKVLLAQCNTGVNLKSYNILRYVWQIYPDLIHIDWQLLSDVIDDMTSNKVESSYTNFQGGLLLNLYVMGLEIDLYSNSLKNREKLMKTFVYKYLSVDTSYKNLKKITRWIDLCLCSASVASLQKRVNSCEGETLNLTFGSPYKLLFDLDRLLFLGIEISRNCKDAVDCVVDEFKRMYDSIVEVERRKLLLQLLSSDLLVLVLTQQVLEESFHVTEAAYLTSFKNLKHFCFTSKPNLTYHKISNTSIDEKYAAESLEELCFLVFYIVKSYLVCKKRELRQPLHMRKKSKTLTKEDEEGLQALTDEACQFYLHLQTLSDFPVSTLSTVTEHYIILLSCLSETKVN